MDNTTGSTVERHRPLPAEQECGDCVFFRNGSESDFCALTMERVECYEKACADFENEE